MLTSCRLEDTEGLTPVQATTRGVVLLCLHHCNHPVYPAAHHRQVRHHHWTTVHFPQTLIFFFTTRAERSSLLPANGPLPSVNQRVESGLASFFIFAKSWRWNFHFVMTAILISSSLHISSKTPTFLCVQGKKKTKQTDPKTSSTINCTSASPASTSRPVSASKKQLRRILLSFCLLLLYLRVGWFVVVTSESSLLLCNVGGRDQRL